jgi:HPt (histidine-containing phosphotransfer) domain-containing protein
MVPVKLDINFTLTNLNHDYGLIRAMAAIVIEDLPPLIRRLVSACESNDRDNVRLFAHTIKGLASNFSIEPLMRFTGALERDYLLLPRAQLGALVFDVESVEEASLAAIRHAVEMLPRVDH